ncbi:MAG TPA: hypothetical protein VIL86_11660 [Tepidisphaeraceae bacterium]|jgi:hypothetical protein
MNDVLIALLIAAFGCAVLAAPSGAGPAATQPDRTPLGEKRAEWLSRAADDLLINLYTPVNSLALHTQERRFSAGQHFRQARISREQAIELILSLRDTGLLDQAEAGYGPPYDSKSLRLILVGEKGEALHVDLPLEADALDVLQKLNHPDVEIAAYKETLGELADSDQWKKAAATKPATVPTSSPVE